MRWRNRVKEVWDACVLVGQKQKLRGIFQCSTFYFIVFNGFKFLNNVSIHYMHYVQY
jgi:hypothetical protein